MRQFKKALQTAIGSAMLLAALGLVAFGPRSTRPDAGGRTVVRYWEKWTDFEGEAMRRLVGVFNDTVGRERGIFVDYQTTTQIDLKALVAVSGGDPPDLVGLWQHNVTSFASRGGLLALDERAAAAGITADMLIPIYFEPCHYHGRLYGLPLTPWSIALYYNKDLFAEFGEQLRAAGYDPNRPPRTLDELAGYSRVIHRRDKNGDITLMGYLPGAPAPSIAWYCHTWPIWFGGSFYDADAQTVPVASDISIRAHEWVRDFEQQFGVADVQKFESGLSNFNSPDNPFMSGRLAMMRQGPWFANMIRQYAPNLNWAAAPFPTHDGSEISFCGQDVLVIPDGAHHPDEAWAFIEWLLTGPPVNVPSGQATPQRGYEYYEARTPDGIERRPMPPLRPIEWICWIHYKNSPLVNPSPEFIETHPSPALAIHERLARLPGAQTEPGLPNWIQLSSELIQTYADIWATGAPVRPRLESCQQRIDTLIELARRQQARLGEQYP